MMKSPSEISSPVADEAVRDMVRFLYLKHFAPEFRIAQEHGKIPKDAKFLRGQELIDSSIRPGRDKDVRQTVFNEEVPIELPEGDFQQRIVLPEIDRGNAHITMFLHEGNLYVDLDLKPILRVTSHPKHYGCSESFLVRIKCGGDEITEGAISDEGGYSLVSPPYHLSR